MFRLLLMLSISFSSSMSHSNVIGVIEEKIAGYDSTPVIRPLFQNVENSWVVLNTPYNYRKARLEKRTEWHIVFDGELLNGSAPINSDFRTFSKRPLHENILRINNANSVPEVANKENRFQAWRGTPKNRPIATNTQPFFQDTERWEVYRNQQQLLVLKKRLFPTLKKQIGEAYHCNGSPDWKAFPIDTQHNDTEIYRAYKNNKEEFIISAGLAKKHTANCDGPLHKSDKPIWFFIGKELKLIGFEFDLVEAADFNNDGKTEFLFFHGGYNEDGYTLFENNFEGRFDYYWRYH